MIEPPEPAPPGRSDPGVSVSPVPDAPVGVGNLAVAHPLTQVTVIKTGRAIPQVGRAIRTAPDQISIVDGTLEVRHDVSQWPPIEMSRRQIGGTADRILAADVFDNHDFSYGLVTERGTCSAQTVESRCAFAFGVASDIAPTGTFSIVTSTPKKTRIVATTLAAAQAGDATLWAFMDEVPKGPTETEVQLFVGRHVDRQFDATPAPIACVHFAESTAAIGLADHFLVAVASASTTCPGSKEDALLIFSVPAAGEMTPFVTSVTEVGVSPAGVLLRPRPDGAWLLVSRRSALELFAVEPDGTLAAGSTTVVVDTHAGTELPEQSFDAIATADGGLLLASARVGLGPVQLARFDASGALVERGQLSLGPNQAVAGIALAAHRERFDIFLSIVPADETDDTALLFAVELADLPRR